MNYLAYSWLEREYQISKAIEMLNVAYSQKQDDPYIIDSVGWGYYLIGDYVNVHTFSFQYSNISGVGPIMMTGADTMFTFSKIFASMTQSLPTKDVSGTVRSPLSSFILSPGFPKSILKTL